MMIKASSLRNKEELNKTPNDKPGYYKWYATKEDLALLLNNLGYSIDELINDIETKDNLYCVYIGVAIKESIKSRLNWHVNDKHTETSVKQGFLSTFRQSISSVIAHNQYDEKSTNDFIDRLYVEYFVIDAPIKSEKAKRIIEPIEKELINSYLRILNIKDNKYPLMLDKGIKKKIKIIRKEAKNVY